jgi:hypothetical protein
MSWEIGRGHGGTRGEGPASIEFLQMVRGGKDEAYETATAGTSLVPCWTLHHDSVPSLCQWRLRAGWALSAVSAHTKALGHPGLRRRFVGSVPLHMQSLPTTRWILILSSWKRPYSRCAVSIHTMVRAADRRTLCHHGNLQQPRLRPRRPASSSATSSAGLLEQSQGRSSLRRNPSHHSEARRPQALQGTDATLADSAPHQANPKSTHAAPEPKLKSPSTGSAPCPPHSSPVTKGYK